MMLELIAGNGHGLAMWWNLKIVSPEPQPIKNTKDEANKQKSNRITSAETAADSDKMPKLTTSSHHIAKPPVGCMWLSVCRNTLQFYFYSCTQL
ncbi:MAG: hypothetical protein WKG06_10650 [Segetibacter sp.]